MALVDFNFANFLAALISAVFWVFFSDCFFGFIGTSLCFGVADFTAFFATAGIFFFAINLSKWLKSQFKHSQLQNKLPNTCNCEPTGCQCLTLCSAWSWLWVGTMCVLIGFLDIFLKFDRNKIKIYFWNVFVYKIWVLKNFHQSASLFWSIAISTLWTYLMHIDSKWAPLDLDISSFWHNNRHQNVFSRNWNILTWQTTKRIINFKCFQRISVWLTIWKIVQ